MHIIFTKLLPISILLSVYALPGNATLVNTSVTGSLTFAGHASNYFDPGFGFVPATGYLNTSGTTVTISDSAIEFGFDDGGSLITADFSDNQVTVKDLIETPGPTNSFQMMFTDPAFAGQYLLRAADSFPLSGFSLTGNVITFDYAGGNPTTGQTLSATFNVTAVPEPSTLGSLSVAVLAAVAFSFARRDWAKS